jgi:hypothetical protein
MTVDNDEVEIDVEGVVYYPSDPNAAISPLGPSPFTNSLAKVPIVFVANGKSVPTHFNPFDRCDGIPPVKGGTLCEVWAIPPGNKQLSPPKGWEAINSYKGLEYFQEKLAGQSIISVSVNLDRIDDILKFKRTGTNDIRFGLSLIEAKANLIRASIDYFQKTINKDPFNVLNNRISFETTGLVGHSQGAEAVIVAAQKGKGLSGVDIKGVLAIAPTDYYWNSMLQVLGDTEEEDEMWKSLKISQFAFMVIIPAADGDVYHCPGAKYYDLANPKPFKSQLYVHGANHNYFNSRWTIDDTLGVMVPHPNGTLPWEQDPSTGKIKIKFDPTRKLPLPIDLNRNDHQQILSVYGCAFFRYLLWSETQMDQILFHWGRPDGVKFDNIHLSFQHINSLTVDNHEDGNGIKLNSLKPPQPTSQSGGLKATEFLFAQKIPGFNFDPIKVKSNNNYTFFGYSTGMITDYNRRKGIFSSKLTKGPVQNLTGKNLYIRVAEVAMDDPPDDKTIGFKYANRSGFELGLQDNKGVTCWIHSDAVGGLSRPYYRGQGMKAGDQFMVTKTMLETMRFPSDCFKRHEAKLDTKNIISILIRTNLLDTRPIAFDDLQIF